MKYFVYLLAIFIFTSCGIGFDSNIRKTDADTFIKECDIVFVDSQHFDYPSSVPSIVFIYSEVVIHCQQQAEILNMAAVLYSGRVMFWAIDEKDAGPLLQKFGNTGKLPVYLFFNQNIAQKMVVDQITLNDLSTCIYNHFGILPLPKNLQ